MSEPTAAASRAAASLQDGGWMLETNELATAIDHATRLPDLLEALEKIIACDDAYSLMDEDAPPGASPELTEALTAARAAIAKAKGEEDV